LNFHPHESKSGRTGSGQGVSTWALKDRAASVDRFGAVVSHRVSQRFALPNGVPGAAMVGIPLGLSSKKSGKSGGFVLTIVLVFVYYFRFADRSVAATGQGESGVRSMLADLVFFAAALFCSGQAGAGFRALGDQAALEAHSAPANVAVHERRQRRQRYRQRFRARLNAAASVQRQLSHAD